MAFTRFTKNVLNVSALPDRVQNQAQTLKATFDQAGVDIKTALNALIVELESSTSAENIGADVQTVATKTVQAVLTAFEEAIADRYTKTEAETLLAEGTNSLVSDIDVNLTTGVITITKKDGTSVTFDTAIEKVPAKFEIVQNGDAYALKITNVDGTSTQADITNFMNIYNFNNGDNITFEVTGVGTEKTVTANIKANSIGLDKLSLTVVSTLEGYMNSAKDSANAAKTSETNARSSELNAKTSEQNALEAQNKAAESAEDAEYWAKQAQTGGGGGITEIPIATADTLGGIKVGEGLEIDEEGVLKALAGGATMKTLFEGEFANIGTMSKVNLLSDSVFDFDYIYLTSYQLVPSNGTKARLVTIAIESSLMVPTSATGDQLWSLNCYDINTSGMGYYMTGNFGDGTQLCISAVIKQSGVSSRTHGVCKVVGVKLSGGYIINGEDFGVDNLPAEGSKNLITSGGVFNAIDSLPYKVLEASTDNVIDFNTLTEPGIYFIKNATNATTLNSPNTSANAFDELLITMTRTDNLYQIETCNGNPFRSRTFTTATNTWSEWIYINNTPTLTGGTLGGAIKANETAVAALATSQIRNITASTTDLTAGTSTLTTGDIYLVYE